MHSVIAIVIAALISGSIYALVAVGFAIAFRVSRVFNLAHGALLVLASYVTFWLQERLGLPVWVAAVVAVLVVLVISTTIEAVVIPAAKAAGLASVDLLVLSWLVLIVAQDALAIAFDNQSIYLGSGSVRPGFLILGARVTATQFCILGVSAAAAILLFWFMRWSWNGRAIIAVGDSVRLARAYGLNVRRITMINALLAAVATACGGVLLVYQERVDPALAFRFSVIGIVSTLVGYRLGPAGAVFGAYVVALLETLVLYLVDPRLRDTAVYVCLMLVILYSIRRERAFVEWRRA
jgi:branched-chain amino acid transport system permease protein